MERSAERDAWSMERRDRIAEKVVDLRRTFEDMTEETMARVLSVVARASSDDWGFGGMDDSEIQRACMALVGEARERLGEPATAKNMAMALDERVATLRRRPPGAAEPEGVRDSLFAHYDRMKAGVDRGEPVEGFQRLILQLDQAARFLLRYSRDPAHPPVRVVVNPGAGPVPDATLEDAEINIGRWIADCGVELEGIARVPEEDRNGRFAYRVWKGQRSHLVQMPGLPLEKVRFMGDRGQNPFSFPRLYVDGSSWLWSFSLLDASDYAPNPVDPAAEDDGRRSGSGEAA